MENILKKLLQNDNATIKEGTRELREALKSGEAITELCRIIVASNDSLVRQYSALVLRKRFAKTRHWVALDITVRNEMKNVLMQCLVNEQEISVKNSIAQLIGVLSKYELPMLAWPELLNFLHHTTNSSNTNDQELGFYTLSILTEIAPDEFRPIAQTFMALFKNTLKQLTDLASPVAFFIIVSIVHLGPIIRTDRELTNACVEMFPKILASIEALAGKRPDRAFEALDFLYDLADWDGAAILAPKIKSIVKLCMELSKKKSAGEDLQMKALTFICILIKLKIKAIEQNHLVVPILQLLFSIMSEQPEDDEDEEYFSNDTDEDTLLTSATETLDELACAMDAEDLIPPLMQLVHPALEGENIYSKKAAYLALGILAQGCDDYIRENNLAQYVQVVYKGIMNDKSVVRNAALFALGQFAEYLQPEISVYCQELMPVMSALLQQLMELAKQPNVKLGSSADRTFYALDKFCENLEHGLGPFLPDLVGKLLALTAPEYDIHVRQLAISTIGTMAGSAKEAIVPFFQEIMGKLNGFLTQHQEPDTICLQVEAVDALAMLAKNIGEDRFRPLAGESIQLGLQLVQSNDDPDIRKSVYGLFASVSTVLKQDMAPILPTIIDYIVKSIKSEEGIINHFKDDEDEAFPVYDSESGGEDDEGDNDNDQDDYRDPNVENDFVEEKEESCLAIKEIAANTGCAFVPFLETCFEEVFKLMSFPNEDVRRAAVEAEFQMCLNISKIESPEGQRAFSSALEKMVSKAALMVRVDEDRDVVATIMECFEGALKDMGPKVVALPTVKDAIIGCVKDVITGKTEAQGGNDPEMALKNLEPDEELIDSAADVIPALGRAMTSEEFAPQFTAFLPLFHERLYTSNKDDDSAKANSVGMLAECMEGLGEQVGPHVRSLLPFLLCLTRDSSVNVRNNAIYAIGEMALHGKHVVAPHYPEILTAFSRALPTEKSAKVLDNICGAISRLIIANTPGVPIEQVLPVLVGHLPLKEDYVEDKWVFVALTHLYTLGNQVLLQHLPAVIHTAAHTLHSHDPDDKTKEVVVNFVKMCYRDFPEDCSRAAQQLPQDALNTLQQACAI